MSTVNKIKNESVGYFESLPKGTQELVKQLILEAAGNRNGPEGYKSEEDCISDVECHSRDGFTAYNHNKGGFLYRNFAEQYDYYGGGYELAHIEANNCLQKIINENLENASQIVIHDIGAEEFEYYFSSDKSKVTCEHINEVIEALQKGDSNYGFKNENISKLEGWATLFQDTRDGGLVGDNSTVMHEFRFMYHGKNRKGLHTASVSAAVNLEAPYHRSSISWAPGVFCEGAKEVEITWKNQAELKRKLSKALKQVSKAVF